MDFYQLDVFAEKAYAGNPLAVFPDASSLADDQMQAIAREMNLSETMFVTSVEPPEYHVRIFTPGSELPFAGHPTVGTAWLLSELGIVTADSVTQHSAAGPTVVTRRGDDFWFERSGLVQPGERDVDRLAGYLGLDPADLTLDWDGTQLHPVLSDAGLVQLMVPMRDVATLERADSPSTFGPGGEVGAYCFTRADEGIRARGFFPDFGVREDPATGSAAAGLGVYLGHFVGDLDIDVVQGVEMGRRSLIRMRVRGGSVSIGGSSRLVLKGSLQALP